MLKFALFRTYFNSYFNIWNFVKVYSFSIYYLIKEHFVRRYYGNKQLTPKDLVFRKQHIAIITGGAVGIGLETVKKLLSIGMHIIIGTPNTKEECLNIKNIFSSKTLSNNVKVWPLDLSSMRSVQHFAKLFLETDLPLHVLINNAGVMYGPYERTKDGFESQFQINYLGHCLLTKLLLPRLQSTGTAQLKSRIVNLSSCTHLAATINFEDLQSEKCYSPYHCYTQSKLAIILFTNALQRRLVGTNVTANSVHPGIVYTNLYNQVWWAPWLGPIFFKDVKEGSNTSVFASVSPSVENIGGRYMEDCQLSTSSRNSMNLSLQERMWDVTNQLLKPWTANKQLINR